MVTWEEIYPDKELREFVKFEAKFFREEERRIRKEKTNYILPMEDYSLKTTPPTSSES